MDGTVGRELVGIMVSGGLDSATLAAWAQREAYDLNAYFVAAGQSNAAREFCSATAVATRLGVPLTVVDVRSLFRDDTGPTPFGVDIHRLGERASHRQLAAMTSFTASLVIVSMRAVLEGCRRLLLGLHADDLEERPVLRASVRAVEDLVGSAVESVLGEQPFRLVLPFAELAAADVVRAGVELGVDLGGTWSCQTDGTAPCSTCRGCTQRRAAFRAAGVEAPSA